MSTNYRMPKGQWRAQVRRKGRYVSQCFVRRKDAEDWALKMERRVDRGESVSKNIPDDLSTFSHLIDLPIADMWEVGKALRRSKTYSLDKLKARLGHVRLKVLDRERIIQFAWDRRAEGAGPATISADISYIKTVLLHASAVHGLPVSPDQVNPARVALKRLGIVGKTQERDRRPTQEELAVPVTFSTATPGKSRRWRALSLLLSQPPCASPRFAPSSGRMSTSGDGR